MKVGDLVRYRPNGQLAIVLYINIEGGTVKALLPASDNIAWLVTSGCQVLNETS